MGSLILGILFNAAMTLINLIQRLHQSFVPTWSPPVQLRIYHLNKSMRTPKKTNVQAMTVSYLVAYPTDRMCLTNVGSKSSKWFKKISTI